MRKGFEGLDRLGVRDRLLCERMSGHLFLFSNVSCSLKQRAFLGENATMNRFSVLFNYSCFVRAAYIDKIFAFQFTLDAAPMKLAVGGMRWAIKI